jgi:hypothetical protein
MVGSYAKEHRAPHILLYIFITNISVPIYSTSLLLPVDRLSDSHLTPALSLVHQILSLLLCSRI